MKNTARGVVNISRIQTCVWTAAFLSFLMLSAIMASDSRNKVTMAFGGNFVSESNKKDTRLAAEIWCRKLASKMGFDYRTEVLEYKDLHSLLWSAEKGEIDMIEMMTPDYFGMKERELIEPSFVGLKNGSPCDTYILLVHRESGCQALNSLGGRKILVERGMRGNLADLWLDTLLMKEGLLPARQYFHQIKSEDTASRCLLPLYFKQADACIVTKAAYDTSAELNPMISKSLICVKQSPPLLFGFIGLRRTIDKKLKQAIYDSALTFHKEVEGRQILMLFGVDSLDRFKPTYIKPVEDLVRDHDSLAKTRRR